VSLALDEWGTDWDQIIDSDAIRPFMPLIESLEHPGDNEESAQRINDAFVFMRTALPGEVVFETPGDGVDQWYGMGHAAIVEWARTGTPVDLQSCNLTPDPIDFVRTMRAHGIPFEEYTADPRAVIAQFGLCASHLRAWGLSIDHVRNAVLNPSHKDSVLRPHALDSFLRDNGCGDGISVWDLDKWTISAFDASFLEALSDADWVALHLTMPMLIALGLPSSSIPHLWSKSLQSVPPSSCFTDLVNIHFGPGNKRQKTRGKKSGRSRTKPKR
jgi:hypothetical protein